MRSDLIVELSTIEDGSMSKAISDDTRFSNRQNFLAKIGVDISQAALVYLTYGGDDYRRYFTVESKFAGDGITRPSTIESDALFTRDKNVALFLPIADCIGAVLYDPANQVLGLAHLGRHNLEQRGGKNVVGYMQAQFGSNPSDAKVWLSPAAGEGNYPLFSFNNKSLHEVALEQLASAGIIGKNITLDARDTTTDSTLFSHSEFLKGNQEIDGRQAVVCMMKP